MAALTTNVVPLTGLQAEDKFVTAAAGGDDCDTGPGVFLHVKNGDTVSHTVTLATPETVDGDLAVADRVVTVVNAQEQIIPVTHRYRDSSTGRASITYDAVTSVTVAVFRVPVS